MISVAVLSLALAPAYLVVFLGWTRLRAYRSALRGHELALEATLDVLELLREEILDHWAVGLNGTRHCVFCGSGALEPHDDDCIVTGLTEPIPGDEDWEEAGLAEGDD